MLGKYKIIVLVFCLLFNYSIAMENSEVLPLDIEEILENNILNNVDNELAGAARVGDVENVKLLLEADANPSSTDEVGTPILSVAILGGKYSGSEKNIATIKLLIEHGANVNAVDVNGLTALDILNLPIMSGVAPHPNLLKARQRYGKEVNSMLESKGAIHSPNWDNYKKGQDKLSPLIFRVGK